MGLSQLASASYDRAVTKQNTAGQRSVLTAALTANNATTNWVQATSSLSADTLITTAAVYWTGTNSTGSNAYSLDIAIGGTGSETVVTTLPLAAQSTGVNFIQLAAVLTVPQRIGTGQAVSVRATANGVNSVAINVILYGVPYANVEGN